MSCTREPGGTPLAERVSAHAARSRARTGVAAGRTAADVRLGAQHVRETILPALAALRCATVSTDSSYACQGGGRGLDPAWISRWNAIRSASVPDSPCCSTSASMKAANARAGATSRPTGSNASATNSFERVRARLLSAAAAERNVSACPTPRAGRRRRFRSCRRCWARGMRGGGMKPGFAPP